ncbi:MULTISPECIES: hypothetical protein [unclassified Bradyrhizobium]|uniref:hypothetical protein n=1 Tax=unclassified Bradyrhizobium TaxID=2631580 RepID=UPI0028EBD695|nr:MULTISPECIES: hypothetical protein [unclassified Bradyrhizobium]
MTDEDLFLSKDKTTVTDKKGKTILVRTEIDGKTIYVEPSLAKASGKYCVSFGKKKICVNWDEHKACIGWDDIEFCLKWETKP